MENDSISKSTQDKNEIDATPVTSTVSNNSNKDYSGIDYEPPERYRLWLYDLILWLFTVTIDCFFREIRPRGAFRLPRSGPVIFVAAPHANQFVDPMILMNQVKRESQRRILFLIAAKSYKLKFIGFLSRCQLSIPVARAQDNLVKGTGKIFVDLESDPLLVIGKNTRFTKECMARGMLALPKSLGATEITEIISDTELRIRKEFKNTDQIRKLLSSGTSFKKADRIDQKQVFGLVFKHLSAGNCIGIFPEGGSHDRTELLPLKAGVAIMALGTMSYDPNCNVKIVPCGMNYFNAHKFRSRAVVEFGKPIEVPKTLVEKYDNPETNRESVKELLDIITTGLKAVTVTCEDYETLMVIQAARRLYAGNLAHTLPLPLIVEMNRRLVLGYQTFKDEPRVQDVKQKILKYNEKLKQLYLPDHHVEDCDESHKLRVIPVLIYRVLKLVFLMLLALPGAVLFSPVFLTSKLISLKKKKSALANSTVKIKANDVVATWKILIGMGIAPLVYIFYATIGSWYCYHYDRFLGTNVVSNFILLYLCGVLVTYSALITGEQGVDIFKSIRPLYLSIISGSSIHELKEFRSELAAEITDLVNTFGPQLFVNDFNLLKLKENFRSPDDSKYPNSDDEEEMKTQELRNRRLQRRKAERKAQRQESESSETTQDKSSTPFTVTGEATNDSYSALSLNDRNSSSISDGISLMNSDNSFTNIPMFSDYNLHKNVNNADFTIPSSSASSASMMDDFDVRGLPTPLSRRESENELEFNFSGRSKSSLTHKIRNKLMENRKKDA
ncbi:uncharacterized protein PRCAT00003073001 [Priceomyces carsonii]|uniref:uncharacterized protein n=1 Tax=Priceomyces carsonii TaxID=28549 RepID=UPI002ED9B8AA|nr:unnamed protein product [Priceomyces carsonii]